MIFLKKKKVGEINEMELTGFLMFMDGTGTDSKYTSVLNARDCKQKILKLRKVK